MRWTLVILAAVGLIACGDITGPHGDVSLAGRIAFVSDTGQYALMHMRPDGSDLEAIPVQLPGAPLELDVSPDGRRLLFTLFFDFSQEVFVVNADGSGLTNLTQSRSHDLYPRWSPDGLEVAFASNRNSNTDYDIHVMNADGSNVRTVVSSDADETWPAWSPDGTVLAYKAENELGDTDIQVVPATGGNPTQLTSAAGDDSRPDWSPDGQRIAFSSQREIVANVWIMSADGSDQRPLIPADSLYGGQTPRWSPDGSSIAYSNGGTDFRIVSLDGHTIAGPFRGRGAAWGPGE